MIKKIYLIITICLLVFPVPSCSNALNNIIPGYGIREINLETNINKIRNKDNYRVKLGKKGIFYTLKQDNVVSSITITNKNYRTIKGIKVGSSKKEVIKNYGEKQVSQVSLKKADTEIGNIGDMLCYDGIMFILEKNKVKSIVIIKSGKIKF